MYILQEYLKSDGNKLAYGDLVLNAIYTSHVQNKSHFYV